METRFNFQINYHRRIWDQVPVRVRYFKTREHAVLLGRRAARRYHCPVRLTEGFYPSTTSGTYIHPNDL